MVALTTPLLFEPYLRPLVWGGRALATVLGKRLPTNQACGESWELSDHPAHQSVVATGPAKGKTLRALMESNAAALLGPAARQHRVFPWLIKFLDARDWLSVQVHPDADKVGALWPGEGPKNEAWYVLAAEPGSWIYAGLLPGVGPRELREALAQGTVAECLHRFQPRAGDCLYLPAGTVHAVGGGVLMAEIQQTSDATFRLYDWDRRDAQGKGRPLHVEQALACIDWGRGPVTPVRVDDAAVAARSTDVDQVLVESPYFHWRFVRRGRAFTLGGTGRLQALTVLDGHGSWNDGNRWDQGQVWLLPAGLAEQDCIPAETATFLLSTLP